MERMAIDYSAFKNMPKGNRHEPILVAVGSTIFLLIISLGGVYLVSKGVTMEVLSGWVTLIVVLALPTLLFCVAIRQDKSTKIHKDAFLRFGKDNASVLSVQLYDKLMPFSTPSKIANYRRSWLGIRMQPSREFLLEGSHRGYDFELSNRFMPKGTGGSRLDPVSMMLEISLKGQMSGPRIICFRRAVDVVESALKNVLPKRLGVKDTAIKHEKFRIYSDGVLREETIRQLLPILSSIRDEFRWDAIEITDDRLFLFGYRRIYLNEWNVKEALEQAEAIITVLASAQERT